MSFRFFFVLGQVHVEKRCLVVRRHPVGNTDVLQPPTTGGAHQRTGGGKRQPHVPVERQTQVRGTAAQLSERDVRDHGRVLETERLGQAQVLGDPLVPAAEKPRVHSGDIDVGTSG